MFNVTNPGDVFDQDEAYGNSLMLTYTLYCLLLTTFVFMAYKFIRYAENSNRLNYESRLARFIAGFLLLLFRALHLSKNNTLNLPKEGKTLIAAGPHRTGLLDAAALAASMEGSPPRVLATTFYNGIPGVKKFLQMFHTIPVDAKAKKTKTRSANSNAVDAAANALKKGGRVVLFPQGNFSYIDKEAPPIFKGVAELAIRTQTPIQVVRLDGYSCINTTWLPRFICNSGIYRAILSGFHYNNIKTTLCCIIDFHLKPKNKNLSKNQLITEISARLYAFFRDSRELTSKDIDNIKKEIAAGKHREIWKNRFSRFRLEKEIKTLKDEYKKLEEANSKEFGIKITC